MSAPRIILSGYILSEKRTVFTDKITVLWELAVYHSVVVFPKLSTAVFFLKESQQVCDPNEIFSNYILLSVVCVHMCVHIHTQERKNGFL